MAINFPEPIVNLPEANIPIKGVKAYLSQAENHQIIFMEFSEDVDLSEHEHESQWGIVLEGKIELIINGGTNGGGHQLYTCSNCLNPFTDSNIILSSNCYL